MPIQAYHRPRSIDEALRMLNRADVNSIVVAGGTHAKANLDADVDEVVDLQALGLAGIERSPDRLSLGAMCRLQDIADHADTPKLLTTAMLNEAPNTFRNAATIGGIVATHDWESEILAALLVLDTTVSFQSLAGSKTLGLDDFLSDPDRALDNRIITGLELAIAGEAALQRVARTPLDRAIVAVCGRKSPDGRIRLAASGIASTPILTSLGALPDLQPPADFRGSSAYRRQMALVLSRRVIDSLA